MSDLPHNWPECARCGTPLSAYWVERHRTRVCNRCRAPRFDGGVGSTWSDPCVGPGRTADYDKFLSSPEWRRMRRDALTRARYRCQVCGRANDRLEVHHVTYERFGGDELPDDLLVCCPPCHQRQDVARMARNAAAHWGRRVAGLIRRRDPDADPDDPYLREWAEGVLTDLDGAEEAL